jgi:hypothetical protein
MTHSNYHIRRAQWLALTPRERRGSFWTIVA